MYTMFKRGFIEQATHEEIRELLEKKRWSFILADPTADSLRWTFTSMIAMAHMQKPVIFR